MTRQFSASKLKGNRHAAYHSDGKPAPGTKLREIYNDLRKGEIVKRQDYGATSVTYDILRNMYGMELEIVRGDPVPGSYNSRGRVIGMRLTGEWEGPYFVPVDQIIGSDE